MYTSLKLNNMYMYNNVIIIWIYLNIFFLIVVNKYRQILYTILKRNLYYIACVIIDVRVPIICIYNVCSGFNSQNINQVYRNRCYQCKYEKKYTIIWV